MDLEEFITKTIVSVVNGMKAAGDAANAYVTLRSESDKSNIDFDIAVTVEKANDKSGEGSIRVWALNAGGKLSSKDTNTTISRIKFSTRIKLKS